MSDDRQLMRNSKVMAAMTALSRVFGLAREMLIASLLGTTRFADIWNMAFMVPNLFRRFLAEGAMTSALVPILSELRAGDDELAERRFARAFFSLVLFAAVMVTVFMIAVMPWFLPALIQVMSPAQGAVQLASNDAVLPTQAMFPYLVFVSLAAVCQGVLNVRDRFGLPAATPIFLNIAIISLGFGLRHRFGNPIWGLCIGVLIGGFLQFALQWIQLARLRFWLWPTLKLWTARTREAVHLWLPITLAAGIYQINVLLSQTISFGLFDGAMAALNYSNRVIELVLGVFATAISTSILPHLAAQKLDADRTKMRRSLWGSIEALSWVTVPASFGLMLCGYTLVSLFFQRGRFDSSSLNLVFGALLIHSMALVPISWYRVLSQTFFAFKHVRISLALSAFAAVLNISLCLLLPPRFDPSYAHIGIAVATLIYAWALVLVASRIIKRRYDLPPARGFMREIVKMVLAALAFVPVWWPLQLERLPLGIWLLKVAISVAIYLGVSRLLGIRTVAKVLSRVRSA